jgi:hypothetical protein
VDLSAIIFVVLAVAWAVYLIPKALKHHDEMASERLVEGHSERVRILSRHKTSVTVETVDEDVVEPVETPAATSAHPVQPRVTRATSVATRASARRAARNRRRVLSVLLLATAVVAGLAVFAMVPWWSVAIPAGLVIAFLVVARLSVRANQRRRPTSVEPFETSHHLVVEEGRQPRLETTTASQSLPAQDLVDLLAGDPASEQRQQAEAVLADDGSLWDPLPLTLPTYVNKARARRTVRTIELTGINSSGHNENDSALAREAAESAHVTEDEAAEQRRVAGA